jgi:hypothetical protein
MQAASLYFFVAKQPFEEVAEKEVVDTDFEEGEYVAKSVLLVSRNSQVQIPYIDKTDSAFLRSYLSYRLQHRRQIPSKTYCKG